MKRRGYLARLARQSGVLVRAAPTAEGPRARSAPAPAGIEVVSERVVAPAATPSVAAAEPRAPAEPVAPEPRVSAEPVVTEPHLAAVPVAPVLPPAAPERSHELVEEAHPVVRVGEARSAPAPLSDAPPTRARIAPEPILPLAPPRSAYAIEEEVIATAGEQAPPIVVRPADSLAVAARRDMEPPSPTPAADATAVPPPARFARALADARRWVSATPAPGEIAHTGTATVPAEETSVSAPPVVVREQIVAAAPDAPAMQELRVSIGRIEVVIDDPTPAATVTPRAPAPVAPPKAPAPMRRLSRHYLRG